MKRIASLLSVLLLSFSLFLGGCQNTEKPPLCQTHADADNNGVCDQCYASVFVYFDLYTVNGLDIDTDTDRLTACLQNTNKADHTSVLLSTGNMLQRASQSDAIQWMNQLGLTATSLGERDFAGGKQQLEQADKLAAFPFLAINVYDRSTDKLAACCSPSVVVEGNGVQVGIIGAIGDCYSSIAEEHRDEVYFKVGDELTALVKAEADRLRSGGADFIVYLLHDGYDRSSGNSVQKVTDSQLSAYYDTVLSNGYVDLVFEGGTSHSYRLQDKHGVYHLQNSKAAAGISYAQIAINSANNTSSVRTTKLFDITDAPITSTTTSQHPHSQTGSKTQSGASTLPTGNTSRPTTNHTALPSTDSTTPPSTSCKSHKDDNNNGVCDVCATSVLVYFDFYAINDLHGKLADTDSNVGVDELTTYLKNARKTDENAVFLSAGDMWQGSSESNLTKGLIVTDWMNELDFAAMSLGNHEFDWGEEYIEDNDRLAEFPFLAINIYNRETNKRAAYCAPSVMVEGDGIQIGIIGAIGDCYSSIASDKCDDVYFKVDNELTALVKAEADSLRARGADFIVYILHDGYGSTHTGSVKQVTSSQISSYYDTSLSNGYIDLVFEGHTHQGYRLQDEYGVYHLQNRGDNKGGISHVEVAINSVTNDSSVSEAELVACSQYQYMADDPVVEERLDKYDEQVSLGNEVLGYNKSYRNSSILRQLMADLYYQFGVETWGDDYDIVLGGGFLNVRSPYNLSAGDVTYGDIQSLFPFDNQLTLCSVKGYDLRKKFFETNNSDYFISYGDYGNSVRQNINNNKTYYIVVDTYTANYAPNRLTIVKQYDTSVFPRDLMAEYVKNGGFS
ncbi:MAG: 5'-nucleotidase C-terminal domain-containing protein [Clostridia bacterium]|nr:5'-nucleotidase C-terminal domain-containing protein [Clostridia bacterium]